MTCSRDEFDNTKLIMDDYVDNKPIVRIGDNAFLNDSQLRMVVFGKHVRAIGDKAFKNCFNLEYLELPKKCCYIGENAFAGCTGLVSVTMLDCWHISKEAFRGCTKLKQVILSEKCVTIESDAFLDCNYLTVLAPEESYAIQYAKENHIAYEYIDSSEERDKLSKNGSRNSPDVYGLEKYEDSFNTKLSNDSEACSGEDIKLSISFAGDIIIHDEHLNSFLDIDTGKFNFDKLFINTKKYFAESNIAIANLETTMGSGEYSGFSCFNTPEEMAEALSKAGFDVIAAANNHIYDTNHNGIIKTKKKLEREGLAVTGIRKEYNEKAYVVIERCGLKTAVLNYTYRSSSNEGNITLNNRVLDAESTELINSFCYETLDKDLEKIKQDIDSARADGANIIIIYYHWGHEYETCSNVIQRFIAYKTALFGADAIIGSHAHVLQEQDEIAIKIKGKEKIVPVFYGMGNYCWGERLPRTGRETIHNGIIGKLDILYNKAHGEVEAINTDYIPLYIKTDYIKDKYDFNILSLDDMEYEEIDAFNLRSSQSVYEIKKQIDNTLRNGVESLKKFDQIVKIPIGERCNLYENKYLGIKGMKLKSENAIVASVFNDGQIVANSVGMVGITAIDDKHEIDFVVKVIAASNNILPTVVDAYNIVPDTYKPEHLKTGGKWGLKEINLERKTAMAWRKMQIAAEREKILLECIDGYRSNEQQLRKIISYAEKFNLKAARKRYMPVGCSEHQLGCALDVTNKGTFKYNSSKEETFEWLLNNAYKFGFSIRRSEKNDEKIDYMHLRYIGDNDVAEYLTENNLEVNQYVRNYKYHYDKIVNANAWKNKFLEDKSSSNKLTLLRICEMIGIEVPIGFKEIQDRIIPDIALSDLDVVQGGIYFYDKNLRRATAKCRRAIREGAVLAVTDRQINDEIGEPLPQIIVEDAFSACVKVGSALRENFDGKVVCVNELGKTRTLRNLLYDITNSVYSVFKNEKLADNRINILNSIRTLSNNNEYEIFIQNLRGVYKNYILHNVEMLNPDVVVLASLYDTHPAKYRDYQEYISDIHSMLEYTLNNNGIAIVNTDYSELRNYAGRKNVISISAFDKKSEYYIKESSIGFRICYCSIYKKGKRKVKKLKYFKRKNIYKYYILAAYAVSDILNIPESTVIKTIEDKFFNKYSRKPTFGRLKTLINIYREENDAN